MIKRILALVLTFVILILIFKFIDIKIFLEALSHPRWFDLIVAFLFFIPVVAITSYRWQILVHKSCHCSFWESTKLQLASNTLNLVLPSKLGDLSKGLFLRNTGKVELSRGMNIVIFEKLTDLSSLGIVYLTGFAMHYLFNSSALQPAGSVRVDIVQSADFVCLAFVLFVITVTSLIYFVPLKFIPGYSALIGWMEGKKFLSKIGYFLEDGQKLIGAIRENNRQITSILLQSIVLWFLHMTQVYFFLRAVDVLPGLFTVYHWAPMAILIGLIPVTISGIGIRDGAFMFLFSDYGSKSVLFAASVLITLRYIIPGLIGTLFLNQYLMRGPVTQNTK